MIITVLSLLTAVEPLKIFELPVKDSNIIVLQAWFKTPNADSVEGAGLRILGPSMLRGSAQYTEKQFVDFASQSGIEPNAVCGEGWIRFQVTVPKDGLAVGAGLIESAITSPSLEDSTIKAIASSLAKSSRSLWDYAIDPYKWNYGAITPRDIRSIYSKFIRRDGAVFAVGGGIRSGDGIRAVTERFSTWQHKASGRRTPMELPTREKRIPFAASLIQLTASPVLFASRATYAKLLASISLGVGKASSLHRVLREDLTLTYLQRLILAPTDKGYVPTLTVAAVGKLTENGVLSESLESINKDIESWSELTLETAKSMMSSSLSGVNPVSPFWYSSVSPLTADVSSQLTFDAYASLVGQVGLEKQAIQAGTEAVQLEELRLAGKSILRESKVHAMIGKG